ncbi:MFS transporter [Rhodococcus rhodnii]|uniref:MFS family transporter n=2 Tax=Rhodococcus rhodnii TaxID=38312 RepID=R7WJ86_9NOCA|nr:MFS transporter [Rhodococcus rhodnii]EOM75310.1 MFS family transporter [Rhodococcus rhodnii LMG 5362]TXG89965.1 MFS transporter [Rhodococcus rhodnii]
MKRVWWVWGAGIFAYVIAVLHRTTFGVAGIEASERFAIGPGVLSSFVVLQVVVYAGMQIPAGVLLDRFGSRTMIAIGALMMAIAQTVLAVTESLPLAIAARIVVGAGDAFTFISVLRLVPQWFAPRRVPLVSQLTGITGQLGQVLSAIPFTALLTSAGWPTAFGAAAALGVLAFVLSLAVIRDSPPGNEVVAAPAGVRDVARQVRAVFSNHAARLGFFTHMGTQFSITAFSLLWGVPYLTTAQGLTPSQAGLMLTLSVVVAIASGAVVGVLSGRYPMRRSLMVLTVMAASAVMWTIVLALPGPAPAWLLAALVVVISVGGPGSMIGFDFARMLVPTTSMGTAQGLVNSGGFFATLLVLQSMGMILDAMGGYTFEAFRVAWCVQYVIWAVAAVGVLVFRRRTRRELGVTVRPLRHAVRERRRR